LALNPYIPQDEVLFAKSTMKETKKITFSSSYRYVMGFGVLRRSLGICVHMFLCMWNSTFSFALLDDIL